MRKTKQIISLGAIALLIIFSTSCASLKKAEDVAIPQPELEAMPTGTQGTYLVKVWSYSKDPMIDVSEVKRNALNGILFEGFKGKPGIPGQVAIVQDPNVRIDKADFFKAFFADGGDFHKYVEPVNKGAIAAEDRMRVGKIYKIGMVCSVKSAELRKHLEESGVLRSLDAGFK
ncbi:MAG: hypothetical protein CVT98_07650 [Bacteroidetes bacterium HGW-Bacteroidetes-15]|nr:MAG: hypothetical protein CVT98_07650 [Bacteroidetes bacterium HGW-Bacteroidetes-15]